MLSFVHRERPRLRSNRVTNKPRCHAGTPCLYGQAALSLRPKEGLMMSNELFYEEIDDIIRYNVVSDKMNSLNDLDNLQDDLEDDGAMWLNSESFRAIYSFQRRFLQTYKKFACEMMISFDSYPDDMTRGEFEDILLECGNIIRLSLRRSDLMVKEGGKFFLFLPEITLDKMSGVKNRIMDRLEEAGVLDIISVTTETRMLCPEKEIPVFLKYAV